MKKNEFFAQLRTAFAGMDEELIMDILSDYENHFNEGMENGKSVTTSISRIRSKIEADGDTYIKTVYGMGYQWTGGEKK